MMTVLKETIQSANTLLLVIKGTETRIDAAMQQMLREMKALFGDDMWNHVVIGVSFWSFSATTADARNRLISKIKRSLKSRSTSIIKLASYNQKAFLNTNTFISVSG